MIFFKHSRIGTLEKSWTTYTWTKSQAWLSIEVTLSQETLQNLADYIVSFVLLYKNFIKRFNYFPT